MAKKIKVILWIILIVLLGVSVYWLYSLTWDTERIISGVKPPSRLDDSDLVYASQYWAGLCSRGNEEGDCYDEIYLYNSGKFIKEAGFVTSGNKREIDPTVEKNLGVTMVNQIIKKIKDSGVMAKDCPPREIMDAGWDYQITIDKVKKSFRNPSLDCQDVFDSAVFQF